MAKALTQRADGELVALGNRGNTNRAVANAATISKGYDEARSVLIRVRGSWPSTSP